MTLSELLKITRQYFWNQSFDEVEIPYLNPSLPLEPNIYSFATTWLHSSDKFYLPTSPEFGLKQHFSQTQTNCFAISHCFRDLEAEGPEHTKEFLMLEWYEKNQDYLGLMSSVEKYFSQFGFKTPFKRFQLPSNLPTNEPNFNQLFLNDIEPTLGLDPVFVVGYPAFLSPLAAPDHQNNLVSQRFELYINGVEIANGCTENRDSEHIKSAFEAEVRYRQKNKLPFHPYSSDFIEYCKNLPPSAGVGVGISRLSKILP